MPSIYWHTVETLKIAYLAKVTLSLGLDYPHLAFLILSFPQADPGRAA